MSVRKSDDFIADVERQYRWYLKNANEDVADRYLTAVEATCRLLGQHPQLGPRGGFDHARLRDWRFFVVVSPLQKARPFLRNNRRRRRHAPGHARAP